MSEQSRDSPYPGPRPFERADRPHFFGRDAERRELASLVIAHREVILYAASGAGKTSLLNAGVIPVLEAEGFEVFRGRIRQTGDGPPLPETSNAYTFAFLSSFTRSAGDAGNTDSLVGRSFAEFFAARKHRCDAQGVPLPRLLIFDQFEELFTVHREFWTQRVDFVTQIADSLERDPLLRILLSIREDFVAELGSYASLLPDGLRIRFRLERLRKGPALDAITGPLRGTPRSFAPGTAESLVRDLLEQRIERRTGREVLGNGSSIWKALRPRRLRHPQLPAQPEKIEGEFVEPVQLQVVCRTLWERLPPDVTEIEQEDLREFGNVDQVLRRLYDDALQTAARGGRVKEPRLRGGFEEAFITPGGTRGSAYRDISSTAGIPNQAIDVFEAKRLLRAEERSGASWYELTHDRLIAPIRLSNELYAGARQRRTIQAAVVVAILSVIAMAAIIPIVVIKGGARPGLTVVPRELNFGSIRKKFISIHSKQITVKTGGKSVRVTIPAISRDFYVSADPGDCPQEGILPAKSVCTIHLMFAPHATGEETATFTIRSANGLKVSKVSIRLTGKGV
jgi:hypothetical protein